jgi:F0F1-type ATP synthase membrane subunit c/vacuolar-type H+-ATPase subunit K
VIKKSLVLSVICCIAFSISSCNKDEINDLNKNVSALQDSLKAANDKYYLLLNTIIEQQNSAMSSDSSDIKAIKMQAVGYLFESIARQPEQFTRLIKATTMLYSDYTELLPLNDKWVAERGKARGIALGNMFDAMARQPEMIQVMDSVAEKFLGRYNSSYINAEILDYSRIYASSYILEALARQPEISLAIDTLSLKYLDSGIMK